jgi:hypothetical protein
MRTIALSTAPAPATPELLRLSQPGLLDAYKLLGVEVVDALVRGR